MLSTVHIVIKDSGTAVHNKAAIVFVNHEGDVTSNLVAVPTKALTGGQDTTQSPNKGT